MMPNSQARRSLLIKTALCTGVIIVAQVPLAQATTLPTGSTVVSGTANISTTGSVMTVDIKSTSPVITWQTFSVPPGDTVKFVSTTVAPVVVDTAQRAVLNRVIGNGATLSPSIINGPIDSTNSGHNNIQVWLVNPAGITFGLGGAYNGGSLILSTLAVPNADFSAGAGAVTHFSKYPLPGGLTYDSTATSAVTLSALAGAIQSTGSILVLGQSVSVGNTVTAGDKLVVVAGDAVTFSAGVGSPLSFTIGTGSSLLAADGTGVHIVGHAVMSGKSITVAAVSQAAALTNVLQADSGATLTATDANGVISLATKTLGTVTVGTMDSHDSLVDNTGTAANTGLIANGTGGAISLAGAGAVTLGGNLIATAGTAAITVDGTTLAFTGGSIKSAGNQTYTGAATLNANTTLTSTSGLVKFVQSIDSAGPALALSVVGNAEFDGAVGLANALSSVSVSGTSVLNAGSIITKGTQTYSGAVTLDASTPMSATSVAFGATVDGARSLVILGNASFAGAVGGTTALSSLGVTGTSALNGGSVKTSADQTYSDAATLGADTTLTSTYGLVRFFGLLDSDATARALTVVGRAEFDSVVGGTNALALVAVTGSTWLSAGLINTTGAQTYSGAVTLGADTGLSTNGGLVKFVQTVDSDATARALDIGGNAEFDSAVGGSIALTSLTVSGTSAINGGAVTTNGAQTYGGMVTLGADTTLTSTGGLVQFSQTLDSDATARALTVVGRAEFDSVVGGTNALALVAVTGTSALNGGSILTTGTQTYNGAVTLGVDTRLTTSSGLIKFVQTVDSNFNTRALEIVGNAEFDSAVGGSIALTSLAVSGTSAIKGGAVTTSGAQTYGDMVTLGADTTLTSAGGLVQFSQTLDSDATARALTVVGRAEFDSVVGGTNALALVAVSGTSALNGGFIFTTGAQTYSGAVTLGADTMLSTTNGGLVKFVQTVDSDATARALGIVGNAEFDTTVGGTHPLAQLTVNAPATITATGNISALGTIALNAATALSVAGLHANGATSDIAINQGGGIVGNVSETGAITAGRNYLLTATSVALGNGIQGAPGQVDITATTGDITGGTVSLASQGGSVVLDAASGTITLGTGSALTAATGNVGIRYAAGSTVGLGDVTAMSFGEVDAGHTIFSGMLATAINNLTIGVITTLANPINIKVAGALTVGAANSTGSVTLEGASVALGTALSNSIASSYTVTADTGAITLAGKVNSGTGMQTYTGAVTLGADTTLTGNTIGFSSTLNGGHGLTITGNGSFTGVVGGVTPLTSLAVSGASTVTGGAVTTTGSQSYSKALMLSANTVLTGSSVGFGSTLDGAYTLGIAGNASFAGAVGGSTELMSLSVSGASAINGVSISTTGTQFYNGAVMLGADTMLSGTALGFGSTVDGAQALTLYGNGRFGGAVGGTTALTSLTVTGTSALNGGSVKTSGVQAYDGAATLGANATLTSTGGQVNFVQTLDSGATARALSIVGDAQFGNVVGGSHALSSVSVSGSGALNGGAITTTGFQTYTGAVTLGAVSTLTGSTVGFGSTLNGAFGLAIAGGGNFGGAVGGTAALTTLSVSGAGALHGGTITTSGAQAYSGAVTLGADATLHGTTVAFGATIDGAHALAVTANGSFGGAVGATSTLISLAVSGTSALNGASVNTVGDQSYGGAATLGADTALTSSGGLVKFVQTLNSDATARALSIVGKAEFDSTVGGLNALASLGVSGTSALNGGMVTTTGAQTYGGAATLGANTVLTGSAVGFASAVDGAYTLTIAGNGGFGGAVGATTALTSVSVSGTSALNGGLVKTTGVQTYGGAATLGANTALTGTTVGFDAAVDGVHALGITGNASFAGAVGGAAALTAVAVSGTSALNGGSVKTTGNQRYSGVATLGTDSTVTSSTGLVKFGATLDGAHSLAVAGNAEFDGAVGGSIALTSLSITKASAINGGTVTTSGAQNYTGAVTLAGISPTVLTTGTGATFVSTLDGGTALTIAGNAEFDGAVGGTTALASLAVSNASLIKGGAVTTTGGQMYTGAVTLAGVNPTVLTTGTVARFGSTLDGANALTIAGNAEFDGMVGGTTALTLLAVSNASTIAGGAVTTTGAQTYTGAVTLGGVSPTVLTGTAATFGSTLDGANALTIAANAEFDGAVGGTSALASLAVTKTSRISGGAVTTTGDQTYTNAVALAGISPTVLTTGTGVTFGSTLDGVNGLTIAGNAAFDGVAGGTTALASLAVSKTSAINGGAITTGGAQTYTGATTLGANTALTSSSGLVKFGAALDGAHTLLVAGNGEFDGAVGGSTALTSLAVSKASAINGGTITTTGGQTYTGAVTLAGVGPTVLTTGTGVTFAATLDGGNALTIVGNAEFDGAVGGTAALASLAVSKTSLIKGGAITTTGGQTYTGAVTLARLSPTVLTTGTIAKFGATLDGADALTIAGNAEFDGVVGGTTALTSLAVLKTSLIKGGAVTTIGAQTYTGAVTLAGISPTILKSGTGVTFGATLDGANALLIAGNAEFDGAVGATSVLTSLAVSKTSAINGGTITTTGAQIYTGAVTLAGISPTVLTTGTGITFAATLDGANALIIAGNADFEGAVGGTTALRSLAVSNTSLIDSGAVTTTGGQTYTGAVTLAGITPTVLKTGTTATFASTVDGVNALTIAGNAVFDGAVGGTAALASLAVSKTSAINGGAVTTTGDETYTGAATLGGASPTTLKTGTAVNFGGTLDGANALTIMGNTAFGSTVGGATALTQLTITAPGAITAAADVNVTGPITFNAARVAVTGAANSGGALAITTSGSTQLGSGSAGSTVNIVAGALTVTGAVKSGAAMVINTGTGAVQLGSLNSGAATTVTGGAITVSGDLTGTGLLTMNAGTGALTITGTTMQSADSALTAATSVNLGVVNAGTNAVTLTAADATLGGLITAANITIIDNGAAGNTLYLGDAGTSAAGFRLDQGEINNLAAANVVFDAGTGVTHQDVGIGNLSLTNAALRMLGVYGLGRIDVSGNFVTGSGSGLTTLQLGGTGTVSSTSLATVLRIAAASDGTGGRIAIGGGALDLRAASIGVGLDTGFLKGLGVTPGSTASQTATFMVSNASSLLYNAQVGGAAYTAAGQSLIVAGSMTVHYTNFALFQNTGGPATNLGVALGSAGKPGMPALSLAGPNPPNGGPFAIFGQINGVSNIPAAILGPTTIVVNAVDRTTARINGCLIGSGAGCLTSTALSTSLADIDPARTTIILGNVNFELPFDPLVATNNDSLFGDVGTFGLDITEPPVDCVPGAKDNCGAHREGKSQ